MLTETSRNLDTPPRPSRSACGASARRAAFTCLRVPFAGPTGDFADAARLDPEAREFILYRPIGGTGLPIAVERRGNRAELLLPQIRL